MRWKLSAFLFGILSLESTALVGAPIFAEADGLIWIPTLRELGSLAILFVIIFWLYPRESKAAREDRAQLEKLARDDREVRDKAFTGLVTLITDKNDSNIAALNKDFKERNDTIVQAFREQTAAIVQSQKETTHELAQSMGNVCKANPQQGGGRRN